MTEREKFPLVPELNLRNYNHDDVSLLNEWACEAQGEIEQLRERLRVCGEFFESVVNRHWTTRYRVCDLALFPEFEAARKAAKGDQ